MADVLALDPFARSHYRAAVHIPTPVDCSPKAATGPVYYRQHEVIQLVEVSAPPPATHPSTITTSSVPSSSAYTESCSEDSDADEEDESAVSSYCSSAEGDDPARAYYDDTYGTRIKRVLAWRDGSAKALGAPMESPAHKGPSPAKRRPDDDRMSRSPKQAVRAHRSPGSHSCSACDSDFPTQQSLREHARVSRTSEACMAAVEYGFES
ncbi:hypothetical protein PsYK624_094290 [Phanerochaete sordida]|uniref:C2H2-type domain-containing protein n=1 Tax=Phanerochaete sordida TaxID=48140 RepID=A0A9P3GGG8_9APHY|nr:hypothetical protein PsYK624_094290 [Phanerochaete sordida]